MYKEMDAKNRGRKGAESSRIFVYVDSNLSMECLLRAFSSSLRICLKKARTVFRFCLGFPARRPMNRSINVRCLSKYFGRSLGLSIAHASIAALIRESFSAFLPRVSRMGAGRSWIFQSSSIPISAMNRSAVFRSFNMTGRPSTQRSASRSNIQNSLRVLRLRPAFMVAVPFPSSMQLLALFA
jgi:hypothetical protein